MLRHHPVPLGGILPEPLYRYRVPQGLGGVPESPLGPIPLDGGVPAGEELPARDQKPLVALVFYLDAEGPQRFQGHLHITAGLEGGGHFHPGIPLQQGQGVEEPGDELAGDIPRQGVFPRLQLPPDGEDAGLLLPEDALFPEEVQVGLLGPLHQPPPAGELPAPQKGQGDGDDKAQGGAGFPAVKKGKPRRVPLPTPKAADLEGVRLRLLPIAAQLRHAPEGGLNVLGEGDLSDDAGPLGQGGG